MLTDLDLYALLQIAALFGLLVAYRKGNRNVMLICGAVPAMIVIALWFTYSTNEFSRGFKEGFNGTASKH